MTVLRLIPPAGHIIPLVDFFRATINYMFSKDNEGTFVEKLTAITGVKHCHLTSSGTAALCIILRALKRDTQRNEVIIPAYTCPSVAAAVVRAGLKIRLCDINKGDFNYNPESLKNTISPDILCIVAVHLFGIYSHTQALLLKDLCAQNNIYLVEDAAQGFGNTAAIEYETSQPPGALGTLGDVGFYSFGRGKPLSLMHGGAIVTNSDELASKIKSVCDQLPKPTFATDVTIMLETFVYKWFFHPRLYWIPSSIPFLKLGETIFSLSFPITTMSRFTIALADLMLKRVEQLSRERSRVSQKITSLLKLKKTAPTGNKYWVFEGRCALLRFPLIFERPEARDALQSRLLSTGIGATGLYPVPLNKQEGVPEHLEHNEPYPNAEYVSKRILTLPTHSLVSDRDVARAVDAINDEIQD